MTTTVTTVGYGDISATNTLESVFLIFMLCIGVMCFSFISGSLTSIITENDNEQEDLKKKMEKLDMI